MTRKALFVPDLLPYLIDIAREAGTLIMTHYRTGLATQQKDDRSPVTEADRAADRLIVRGLSALTPDIRIVSEEGDKPDITREERFWLVDPLDGTKSFIRGSGHFTVNIGLIENRLPVLGVIYDPQTRKMYYGHAGASFLSEDDGAARSIRVRQPGAGRLALTSHNHLNQATEDYLTREGISERQPCASSIKFCMLAEGLADLYPRFGPTSEWDTAAGHAILLGAGGRMTTPEGGPFLYGKDGFLNGNFVASA